MLLRLVSPRPFLVIKLFLGVVNSAEMGSGINSFLHDFLVELLALLRVKLLNNGPERRPVFWVHRVCTFGLNLLVVPLHRFFEHFYISRLLQKDPVLIRSQDLTDLWTAIPIVRLFLDV